MGRIPTPAAETMAVVVLLSFDGLDDFFFVGLLDFFNTGGIDDVADSMFVVSALGVDRVTKVERYW